ncbi:uncharacterized protein EV420DRAFT_1577230 [Desarmillaria tabescens]|uniref:Uncharacterized protein n=1 Tax=Armillaria tabescens TaxID=1929756 RepID=A0AA39JJS7_ARMTA|nr:uncharacterized protein EV420DRAFT_1577230 [Desarmillaria tabescens]KAK0443036.1 hypothetical protein EV420DRAFT_1577230 [Desarmillaria tabescens]
MQAPSQPHTQSPSATVLGRSAILAPPNLAPDDTDRWLAPVLRTAPDHLRKWFMDMSSRDHDKIYMTEIDEEAKTWIQEHREEVIEAMPVRLETYENNIILQIPSQIHQFAGQVIKEAINSRYKSGTHSIIIMESADIPLLDKHWKQCDIQIYDLEPPPDSTSTVKRLCTCQARNALAYITLTQHTHTHTHTNPQ